MPGIVSYQRFVIKGTGPASEIFQTSFTTVSTAPPTTQAQLQALCTSVAPFVVTMWNAIKAQIANTYALQAVAAYQYQGLLTTAQFQALTTVTPNFGTLSAGLSPIDTCMVQSLRTTLPGRSGRGRMYLPYHNTCGPNGMFSSATIHTTYAQALKAMFGSLISGTTLAPAVVSRTTAQYNLVTQIVTDNKPDVQRRRENRLTPTLTDVESVP